MRFSHCRLVYSASRTSCGHLGGTQIHDGGKSIYLMYESEPMNGAKWAQRFSSIFEQIQNELETLSEYTFQLASCKQIYSVTPYTAPSVQKILASSYKNILVFWYRVTKELRRPCE